ncbi:MAG TPA: PPC domain-containing protein [Thermoanaerobaculia bacterium]
MKSRIVVALATIALATFSSAAQASDSANQELNARMFAARNRALASRAGEGTFEVDVRHDENIAAKQAGEHTPHTEATCPAQAVPLPATMHGVLTASSCLDNIGLREDVYTFSATAGQLLTVEMSSSAFDVFLYMTGATGTILSYRFSDGVSTERLVLIAPSTGTYKVEAEALWPPPSSEPNTGPYAVTISAGAAGSPPPSSFDNHACGLYPIDCNTSQSARLTFGSCTLSDGSFSDFYTFHGVVGEMVTVNLTSLSSTYTRPFVALLPPQGDPASTPYGTGTTVAAITKFKLTSTGTWAIGVSTLDTYALGNYTVSLSCTDAQACMAPSIIENPQSWALSAGQSALLTVNAVGTATMHFAWHSVSAPYVTVGNDSYRFQTPALTQNCGYFVVVSNSCGSATSMTSQIAVTPGRRRSVKRGH